MPTNPDDTTSFPGIDLMNRVVNAYFRSWKKQVNALNTFWGDVSSGDADPSKWFDSYGKLVHAYTDSIKSAFGGYSGYFTDANPYCCPVVPITVDKLSQSSGVVCVPISSSVDTTKIVTPQLKRFDGTTLAAKHLIVTPDPDACSVNVSIGFLQEIAAADKTGDYVALVYSNNPPYPLPAIALVVLHWT